MRMSCRKLSFQDTGDKQLEVLHQHWGRGWEGGTARGVSTVGKDIEAVWGQGWGCSRDLLAPAPRARQSCKRPKC